MFKINRDQFEKRESNQPLAVKITLNREIDRNIYLDDWFGKICNTTQIASTLLWNNAIIFFFRALYADNGKHDSLDFVSLNNFPFCTLLMGAK